MSATWLLFIWHRPSCGMWRVLQLGMAASNFQCIMGAQLLVLQSSRLGAPCDLHETPSVQRIVSSSPSRVWGWGLTLINRPNYLLRRAWSRNSQVAVLREYQEKFKISQNLRVFNCVLEIYSIADYIARPTSWWGVPICTLRAGFYTYLIIAAYWAADRWTKQPFEDKYD